jgi:hypothetical protein
MNMKKIIFSVLTLAALLLAACTTITTPVAITDNPVGTKTGEATAVVTAVPFVGYIVTKGDMSLSTAAGFPPILPLTDLPCHQFVNPAAGTTLLVSRLNPVDQDAARLDPAALMKEYRKNLAAYYKIDSIAANEFILGDFRRMVMNFLYEPGEQAVYITKVLYHRYSQQYFMIDLYINRETPRLGRR